MAILFWIITLVYMEVIVRIFCLGHVLDIGLLFAVLFSVLVAIMIKWATSFCDEKRNRIIGMIVLGFITFLYVVQSTYQIFFGKFLVLYSIFAGGFQQITDAGMFDATLRAVKNGLPSILLMLLPFTVYCIWGKKLLTMKKSKLWMKFILPMCAILVFLIIRVGLYIFPEQENSYNNIFDMDRAVDDLGLMYAETLDFKYNVLKVDPPVVLEIPNEIELEDSFEQIETEIEEVEYEPNIMEIDFETILNHEEDETVQMLHRYFMNEKPTYQNEYTGMFEGYNLIMITAEGFSPYVIDEKLTPTLYKMSTEGFQFKNFYTPIWGVSTSDGEYVNCSGLLPMSGVWSMYESGDNYMPFFLGNRFEEIGVKLRHAYHNHTYDYYHRDISHPNMGYEYKGLGNGLSEEQIKKTWPESDLDMIEATVGDYVQSEEPFITYYMTVSGHLEYTRIDNAMAYKNWEYVDDLSASENVKAYYACNIELDRALEKLMSELESAGIAEKTVIVLAADHYPYGLETGEEANNYRYFNEILGHEVETDFELYKSTLLLYSPGMEEAITVDKYASNLDILPTLLNLFGIEYDSRLLIGNDILSDEPPLVIFANRNWISECGRYIAKEKEFQVFGERTFVNAEEKEKYVEQMNEKVEQAFEVSALILSEDYYAKLFENKNN